jgi:hypothetical protein
MAKKYLSKINKGGNDLYIKDSEAREAIAAIGTPATTAECISAANELT